MVNCAKFDAKCYYFYISAVVSISLIGVCTAIIFTKTEDPCLKNTAVGILTSILTFWANPPRLQQADKKEGAAALAEEIDIERGNQNSMATATIEKEPPIKIIKIKEDSKIESKEEN